MKRMKFFFKSQENVIFKYKNVGMQTYLRYEYTKKFKSQLKRSVKTCTLQTCNLSNPSKYAGGKKCYVGVCWYIDQFKLIAFQVSICLPVENKRSNLIFEKFNKKFDRLYIDTGKYEKGYSPRNICARTLN